MSKLGRPVQNRVRKSSPNGAVSRSPRRQRARGSRKALRCTDDSGPRRSSCGPFFFSKKLRGFFPSVFPADECGQWQ
jgi:hypothetical protein